MIEKAIARITEQQQGLPEEDNVFCVGEQLKDICREGEAVAELIYQDLENPEMSLAKAEAQINKKADELHKKNKGRKVCVNPLVADKILRDFYCLPPKGEAPAASGSKLISLDEYM